MTSRTPILLVPSLFFCTLVFAEGQAWQEVTSGVDSTLRCVSFADKENAWAVGDKGGVLHSKDAGKTWEPVKTPSDGTLRGVHFVDKEHGFVVGDGDSDAPAARGHVVFGTGKPMKAGSLLITTDAGTNWQRTTIQTNFELRAVWMASDKVGQICNHGGSHADGDTIVTKNGGKGWRTDRVYRGLNDCFWLDEQEGWAVGSRVSVGFFPAPDDALYTEKRARIVHTSDGGKTWAPVNAPGGSDLRRVRFADKDTGVIVGDKGAILRTTDAGKTWEPVKTDVTANLFGLAFADAKHGWIVGAGGVILETKDAGATWTSAASPTTKNLFSVDSARGGASAVAVGADGTIIRIQ